MEFEDIISLIISYIPNHGIQIALVNNQWKNIYLENNLKIKTEYQEIYNYQNILEYLNKIKLNGPWFNPQIQIDLCNYCSNWICNGKKTCSRVKVKIIKNK